MPVSPARAAAFDILLRVEQQDAYAAELLHARQYANLSHPDHALATELVMGVLRWRSLLDERISTASSRKLANSTPKCSLPFASPPTNCFSSRIPARAALNESVELVKRARKRSAATFVNVILRKLSATIGDTATDDASRREDRHSVALAAIATATDPPSLAQLSAHPLWLVERWVHEFGCETAKLICLHNQSVPVTAICLRDPALENELRNAGVHIEPGCLLSSARTVLSVNVTKTRAFAEGRVATPGRSLPARRSSRRPWLASTRLLRRAGRQNCHPRRAQSGRGGDRHGTHFIARAYSGSSLPQEMFTWSVPIPAALHS